MRDIDDHAPVLKATMLMCTTKQGLMTPRRRRRWRRRRRIDTPTRSRLAGHANAAAAAAACSTTYLPATAINDQWWCSPSVVVCEPWLCRKAYAATAVCCVLFLDAGNDTNSFEIIIFVTRPATCFRRRRIAALKKRRNIRIIVDYYDLQCLYD